MTPTLSGFQLRPVQSTALCDARRTAFPNHACSVACRSSRSLGQRSSIPILRPGCSHSFSVFPAIARTDRIENQTRTRRVFRREEIVRSRNVRATFLHPTEAANDIRTTPPGPRAGEIRSNGVTVEFERMAVAGDSKKRLVKQAVDPKRRGAKTPITVLESTAAEFERLPVSGIIAPHGERRRTHPLNGMKQT